jgi:hypothetical protein
MDELYTTKVTTANVDRKILFFLKRNKFSVFQELILL